MTLRTSRRRLALVTLLALLRLAPSRSSAQMTPALSPAEEGQPPSGGITPMPVAPTPAASVSAADATVPSETTKPGKTQAVNSQDKVDASATSEEQSVYSVEHSILRAVVARNDLLDQVTREKLKLAKAEAELNSAQERLKIACSAVLQPSDGSAPTKSQDCIQAETSVLAAQTTRANLARQVVATRDELDAAQAKLEEVGAPEITTSKNFQTLKDRLARVLDVRCLTAICWGGTNGRKWGVEPLIDLPVGIVWSVGRGSLSSYINSSAMSVEFNAGLRLWVANDLFSVSVYFAKPVARQGDSIRLRGSPISHSVDAIHRPYPSIGFGFFGDVLHFGIAYDVLVNRSDERGDPSYPPNEVLSRSISFTLGISTFTTARNAIAAGTGGGDRK